MGAVCKLGKRKVNISLLKLIFLTKCEFALRFKGLQLSKFTEILNSNAKPDKYSNHSL